MNPRDCKYFINCSMNVCPLDKDRKNKEVSPLDKQKKCKLKKGEISKLARPVMVIINTNR